MRHLRRQLIDLLDLAREQHRMEQVPPRLMAVLVKDFLALLPQGGHKRIDLRWRTLSHGNLHRHIFTIRCPDQAFYLDAIKGYLLRHNIQPIGQQTMVGRISCNNVSCLLELRNPDIHDEDNFMFIALHFSATMTPDPEPLRLDIQAILQAVDLTVSDFQPMRTQIAQYIARLMPEKPDAAALLDWMNDDHYLYFGIHHGDKRLGLMKNRRVFNRVAPGLATQIETIPPPDQPGAQWLNLAASQHYLYSAASIEVVRLCWTGPDGLLEYASILGHFSRSARSTNASYLPVMATSWRTMATDDLLQHSAFYRREIRTLFDRLPKRLLLATDPSAWLTPLKATIDLANPLQVVAEIIPSRDGNIDTLLIAISSNRFGPVVMEHMITAVETAGLKQHGYESFGIGPHRIILIAIEHQQLPADSGKLYTLIRNCIVFWKDLAKTEVLRHAAIFDIPETLHELESISSLYQDLFPPAQFTRDMQMRKRVLSNGRTAVHVTPMHGNEIVLLIYSREQPSLGKLVDVIRAFGLDPLQEAVVPFGQHSHNERDATQDSNGIHISSLTCRSPITFRGEDANRLRRGLAQVLNDEADHDPLNALVLLAELSIEETAIMICLRNHLIQLMPDAAKLPLTDMMLRLPQVSSQLMQLFAARHITVMPDSFLLEARSSFDQAMADVANLNDDRWFRALAELVQATTRTNAFIRDTGAPIGIKIAPAELHFVPQPRPWREIFVHGVHVEGVHLRAGPIARGGLRFSDRPSDFRTEALELRATQVVKNGQIVPTGSKGCFVVRDGQGAAFVLSQYHAFIRTMLALTDNLMGGKVAPPEGMVITDNDHHDPYFVVAADKGTARYSDDANAESEAAGFWLGDAFASGGRHGYDHKKVGITARGAWVCAAHHFTKLGINAYQDPISCVGIGDMGGDVFGNGMLLNPNMKLIAAFNHQHIFLDPEPDPKLAHEERNRMFTQVCGWDAYDPKKISRGGGVFERSAKKIPLTKEIQALLGIEADALSGESLIQAILCAPVDMLYNGGIGTYVKASHESHMQVQDPINNPVRVNADKLRCRIVCEGGNLGFTQKARIEYALSGGMINTDAMDNSAGVDMSDHEVNLKILLDVAMTPKPTVPRRNQILEKLTDAVTDLCLNDNLMQARAMSLAEIDATNYPSRLQRLRDGLVNQHWLDPGTSPDINRNELIMLRPLISMFLGQEKNRIHARLSQGGFDHSSSFSRTLLLNYFPTQMHRQYSRHFAAHPLASEIIQTTASNHVVNHFGLTAVHHMETLLHASTSQIVEALLIAEYLLDAQSLREAIWQQLSEPEQALILQYRLQQQLMIFAENLLRLCRVDTLDSKWLEKQRRGLRQFRRPEKNVQSDQIHAPGLGSEQVHHISLMQQLAQSACAVHIASEHQLPLHRCLLASRRCLEIFPFEVLESHLRSPEWSDDDAHNLRREWLNRLTLLQHQVILTLLQHNSAAEKRWQQHRYWPEVNHFMLQSHEAEHTESLDTRRMRLLLILSRLESLIESQHSDEANQLSTKEKQRFSG